MNNNIGEGYLKSTDHDDNTSIGKHLVQSPTCLSKNIGYCFLLSHVRVVNHVIFLNFLEAVHISLGAPKTELLLFSVFFSC